MKRIVSYLLAVILVFSLCVDAFAEPGEPEIAGGNPAAGEGEWQEGTETKENESIPQEENGDEGTEEGNILWTDVPNEEDLEGAGSGENTNHSNSNADQNRISSDTGDKDSQEDDSEEKEEQDEEGQDEEDSKERSESTGNWGQVDVEILSALDLRKDVSFTVSLTGQEPKQVILAADQAGQNGRASQADVTFEDLEPGTYVLTVAAPGFASYTQEIAVEDWAYALTLTTGMVSGFAYDQPGSVHPGLLLVGDVDGNGVIDDTDRDLLVDAIDAGERDPEKQAASRHENPNLDLNGDQWVDLADLEYLAKGYGFYGDGSSSVEKLVPAEAVTMEADADTEVSGDLNALLKNEGGVTLSTKYGSPISGTQPVSVIFDFAGEEGIPIEGMVIDTGNNDSISDMQIDVVYMEEGQEHTAQIPLKEGVDFLLNYDTVQAAQNESGVITINFGAQTAVKKVTLKIMGMRNNNDLAEISKVEFLNDMESRIPEPQMDIPQNLSAQAGNKQFDLTWDPCVNVTGYEVRITAEIEGEQKSDTVSVKGNSARISSFQKGKLVNNTAYTVSVQSVNGAWRSGYSESVEVVPKADKKPDAPDNLRVTGAYRAIDAAWKNMEDTDRYNLYYRESGKGTFQKIEGSSANKYTITGLKDRTSYEVYVTGVNELGEGKPSLTGEAETTSPDPAQMPKYKLLNRAAEGAVSEHIKEAYYTQNGTMQDSAFDAAGTKTAWGTVDNDPVSHYLRNTWDDGGFNNLGSNGLTYEFDQEYKMQYFALQEVTVQSLSYGYAKVKCWDANGNRKEFVNHQVSVQRKMDSEKRVYYMLRLPEAVTVKKIQFGLSRSLASGSVTCSEVYFYHYDSLEDDIMALYVNDLHTELRSDVTQTTIDALRTRINTKDPDSGEYHPDREKLERELKTAEDILNAKLSRSVYIHNSITTQDANRGFGGLNAWQPLGVTAAAGEEITVYVGHNTKKTGESTNLQLIATQYHAESGSMFQQAANLKIGRNDITIPQLSTVQGEAGGALYVQYTGSSSLDQYAVRVSGGAEVPFLDLYQVTDAAERQKRAQTYVKELQTYVEGMEAQHEKLHQGSRLASVNCKYEESGCILGASDIMLDTMMLSLPASQILKGAGGNAERILTSAEAMENMMDLFYQHKGLTKNPKKADGTAVDVKDTYPSRHLNIRYQRMFAGAFMYAAGNHIGIEWGSAPGMVSGNSLSADSEGRYQSGNYFGWGIAHEIGHCINQGSYAVAEITNNYFSVLAQAKETNGSVRFQYDEVYKKVTSGTKGRASNVFTQLGMYWQLHLAFDNGYNFKTYDDYDSQLANLFFARVDTYARTPSRAPKPGGVELTLPGDQDQNLMRLACAAAEKDLLEFFERWGMTPNEGTIAYAKQFAPETRAICYVNDEARVYRLTHGGSSLDGAGSTQTVTINSAELDEKTPNQVNFQLSAKIPAEDILGYEIVRCTTSGGEVLKELAGFTTTGSFSDHVTTMNNRVVSYQVTVIDKYLNRSAPVSSGELKIQHDGSIDKSNWTVKSNDLTAAAAADKARNGIGTGSETEEEIGGVMGTDDQDTICGSAVENPIKNAADDDPATNYAGMAGAGAEVIMEFHKTHTVTGFKYTPAAGLNPIRDYTISVRESSGQWKEAASGTFDQSEDPQIVYFGSGRKENNDNLAGYQATAVKLAIKNQAGREIGIAELDVLGVTGDDVDFRRAEGDHTAAIGKLTEDFVYDSQGSKIPAGSLVFTGVYKGNPAYNVVILYDQAGNIVGGEGTDGSINANQIILAEVPDTGNIQDVSDGTWVYWIEPDHMIDLGKLKKVRAELYRVDDAGTNAGQRLVSDSMFVDMPGTSSGQLPDIELTSLSQSGSTQ